MRAHRAASILGAGACLAGAWTAAAIAAPDGAATKRAPELQAIVDCRALTDRDARLNCYDSAAANRLSFLAASAVAMDPEGWLAVHLHEEGPQSALADLDLRAQVGVVGQGRVVGLPPDRA